ncbi:MAG: hypothetical protein ACFE9R_09600, partial [Candidatus Hermodarchaeota archaeon]
MELNILDFGYKSLQNIVHIKTIAIITILQNICCIVFGIFYLILPAYVSAWDAFGIILPITLFVNLLHIYLSSKQAKKSSRVNSRLYTYCSILLIYYMISIFSIMGGNLLLSVATVNDGVIIGLGYFLIHFFYFSLMILNVILGMINLKLFKSGTLYFLDDTNRKSYSSRYQLFRRLSKKPLNIISSIIFLLSIVFAIVIV